MTWWCHFTFVVMAAIRVSAVQNDDAVFGVGGFAMKWSHMSSEQSLNSGT